VMQNSIEEQRRVEEAATAWKPQFYCIAATPFSSKESDIILVEIVKKLYKITVVVPSGSNMKASTEL
ncbi:hypothetical protein H0E87_020561, partial [Populus deltoides]